MFDTLRQTLETLYPLSTAEWDAFRSCLRVKQYAKNEPLLSAGQICKGIFFVKRGAFRSYIYRDGSEVHTSFSFETDYITDYESLTKQQSAVTTIVAMEPAETIYFGRDKLIALYQQTPTLMQLGRIILENVIVQRTQYAALFTLYSPTERYNFLLENYPQIVQRVPVQYIAS